MTIQLKINIIVPFIYRVGGIKLIIEYANRLTLKGHDIAMYYPIYPYNTYKGSSNILYNLIVVYKLLKQLIFVTENKDNDLGTIKIKHYCF